MYSKTLIFIISTIYFTLFYAIGSTLNGRYTRDIVKYELIIPRKLNNEGKFKTYQVPHSFEHKHEVRSSKIPQIFYLVTFDGAHNYLELWPNHQFVSTDAIVERREPNLNVQLRHIRKPHQSLCYYHGRIKDRPGSRVALSTCYGLAGYIVVDGKRYFIEPADEYEPNQRGQQLHLIYRDKHLNTNKREQEGNCGTSPNWEDAWKRRFYEEYTQTSFNKRSTLISVPRYLETLVVADKKFLEYHKHTDHDSYVLTIMNMVSDYYHDASSGHQLHAVVVRVMYLEKEEQEIDLVINPNAEETLASFCKWQQKVNPKDIQHPNHHDIAVLLTRYDICSDSLTNCGLMGLAYVAAACTSDRPCAINEDGGLVLGVVVAHEMGHVMGCSHDTESESGCKPQAPDNTYYVMSPYVHIQTGVWSTCSRVFMNELFDNNLGECLNDEPQESIYKETNILPGAVYDAKYQCNMAYPGSEVCGGSPDQFCKQLLCKVTPTTCMTNGEPPADGTKCAENKWCYNTKCIEIGSRPEAINGEWGEWGSWTVCSRSCGGGVSFSQRECNNPPPKHRGHYCLGERKRIKICNTIPCPEGAKSFRAVQCSELDKKPFQGKLHKWEPYPKKDEPCVLFCINERRVYSKLAPRVKDGTKCKPGTKDMCVSGVCKKVGCDNNLDSDAIEDQCGICKGDGTQCKIIEELYQDAPGHGYVKVTTIMKGSRNIYFDELKPSDNTLAVSGADEKKFYLNGDFTEQQDGVHDIGGVEGVYNHPEPNKESLVIYGPLKEDIVLFVVYYSPENVGYMYKYSEPASQNYQPRYHWEFVEYGDCPVRCGGGILIGEPDCLEEIAGKVSPSFCQGLEKPPTITRKCNEQPCRIKWRVGKWGTCTACKFQSGVRMREVECVRESEKPGEEDALVEDEQCPPPKPGRRELCNSHKKCSKNKRHLDGFSPEVMEHLWLQTMDEYMSQEPLSYNEVTSNPIKLRRVRQDIIKKKRTQRECPKATSSSNSTLKIGSIVKDRILPEEIKLIEVPLIQSQLSLNLTDESYETMGDKISDTLDINKEKIITGKEAAVRLKALQHSNDTKVN